MIEPPCTERYARWCERSAGQLMVSLLLDFLIYGISGLNRAFTFSALFERKNYSVLIVIVLITG